MNLEIRRASVRAAALLSELAARMFEQAFGSATEPDNMRDYLASTFSVEIQAAELADPDRATFIAVDSTGAAIGYAMLRRNRPAAGVAGTSPGELQRIYVDRALHGQGVGDALLTRCVEQAQAWGCDAFWLSVWRENPRASPFYRRAGFETVGVQTFAIGRDIQHDFIMARLLP